jgi:hypothetical protein
VEYVQLGIWLFIRPGAEEPPAAAMLENRGVQQTWALKHGPLQDQTFRIDPIESEPIAGTTFGHAVNAALV